MREMQSWIEIVLNVMLVICAILAVLGIYVCAHFILKHW